MKNNGPTGASSGDHTQLMVTNGADRIYTFMGPRQLIEFTA